MRTVTEKGLVSNCCSYYASNSIYKHQYTTHLNKQVGITCMRRYVLS